MIVDFKTNPIDHIASGTRWVATEGQTRILAPMTIDEDGELLVAEGAHLILE